MATTSTKQQSASTAARKKVDMSKVQKAPQAPPVKVGSTKVMGQYAARQSSKTIRAAPTVIVNEHGKKVKIVPRKGSAAGAQDVIIHKDSWMLNGVQAYTPLTSVTIPALLGAIASTGNLTLACEQLNMSRLSVYAFKGENPEFAQRLAEAQRLGVEAWKDEAARRAFQGWERPIYQQGLQVGAERQWSDTLALALLKAADPEHFQDRSRMELGPMGSNSVVGMFADKSDTELAEAMNNKLRRIVAVTKKTS